MGNYYLLLIGGGGGGLVRVEEGLHVLLARSVLLGLGVSVGLSLGDDLSGLGSSGGLGLGESLGRGGGRVELSHNLGAVSGALADTSDLDVDSSGSDDRLDLVRVDDGSQIGVGHLGSEESIPALERSSRLVGSENLGEGLDG